MCGNAVANGQTSVCENHVWDGGNIDKTCKPGTVPWNLATVAAGMYKDDNEGNDPWKGTVTTYANGKVFCEGYYPTDANSIDQRNTANGLGLHPSQDHACFGDVCITGQSIDERLQEQETSVNLPANPAQAMTHQGSLWASATMMRSLQMTLARTLADVRHGLLGPSLFFPFFLLRSTHCSCVCAPSIGHRVKTKEQTRRSAPSASSTTLS